MRLSVSAPVAIVLDLQQIASLRAEDESGMFGVLPGHADLMTALIPCVLSWHDSAGLEGFCAVRGGVLSIIGGHRIQVATREAVVGTDLERLENEVVRRFRTAVAEEESARVGEARLQTALMRQILTYLRPERGTVGAAMPRGGLSNLE